MKNPRKTDARSDQDGRKFGLMSRIGQRQPSDSQLGLEDDVIRISCRHDAPVSPEQLAAPTEGHIRAFPELEHAREAAGSTPGRQ